MLTPKHCEELDIFKCGDEVLEETDLERKESIDSQKKDQAALKSDVFYALKYIFTNRDDIESIPIEIDDVKITYSEFLNCIKVLLKFKPEVKFKKILKGSDLNKLDTTVDETFASVLIIRNLHEEFTRKLEFIWDLLTNFQPAMSIEIEDSPFEIRFEDITKHLLMQYYTKHLIKPLTILNESLDVLLGVSETTDSEHSKRVKELNKSHQVLGNIIIYNEQSQAYQKFVRIGNAFYLTRRAILDGEKQKILNFLVHILKQHPVPIVLQELPQELSKVEKEKYQNKFRKTLTALRQDVIVLKSANADNTDIFEKIEYALDILAYQNSYIFTKELDCIKKIIDILKNIKLSDISIHLRTAHERSTNICKEYIISTLAEVYSGLDDLDSWIKLILNANINAKINFCTYEDGTVLLKEMKNKITKKLEVKKSTQFLDEPNKKVPVYQMRSNYRGTCLIINNINYTNAPRHGANIDEANLENIFKQLKFNVFTYRNSSKTELFDQLENIKKFDSDCLFVIVMSHGDEGNAVESTNIQMVDGDIVAVSDVLDRFTYDKYTFAYKPKIFMFQLCRGGRSNVAQYRISDDDHANLVPLRTLPNVSNTLISFASPPGYLSKRHPINGSFFITEFCDVFRNHAHDTHMEDMLIILDNNIKGRRAIDDPMQTCCFENRGFKHCFFHPGLYDKQSNYFLV